MVRRFIKNTSWVLGSNVLSKAINFLTLGLLARVLGPDQLGFYNAVQNTGNYVNMMSSLGTVIVTQRVGAKVKELGENLVGEIFSNVFTLYLIINTVAAFLIALFPKFFFDVLLDSRGNINYVFLISILIILNAISQIPLALIQGLEEFRKYAIRNFLSSLTMLIITALCLWLFADNNKGAYYGLLISFIVNAIITMIVFFQSLSKHNLKIKFAFDFPILKSVLSEGFMYYAGNTLLGAIVGLVTISVFYKQLSSFEYGFTRIGSAMGVILSIIPAAVQPVTISLLTVDHIQNQFVKSIQIRIIPFVSTIFFVVVALNLKFLLKVFFGGQYIGAQNIVFGMVLVQIPYLYLGLINNYQVGRGHLNFIGWVATVGCVVMISGIYLLVPHFGIKGYFLAMYVSTFISLGMVCYKEYFRKKIFNRKDWNSVWINLFIILLSYWLMQVLPPNTRIPVTILFVFVAIILFWKLSISQEERLKLLLEWQRLRLKLFFR